MSYLVLKKTTRSKDAVMPKSLADRQQAAYDKHVQRTARRPKNEPPTLARPAVKFRKTLAPASLPRPKPKVPVHNNALTVPKTRNSKTTQTAAGQPLRKLCSLYNTDGDLITDEVVAKAWPVRVPPSAHPQSDFLSKFAELPDSVEEEEEEEDANSDDDDWWQYLPPEEPEPQAKVAVATDAEDSFLRWLDSPEEVVLPVEPQLSLEDRLAKLTMSASISVPEEPQDHRSRQAISPIRPGWSILLPRHQMKLDQERAADMLSRFKEDDNDEDDRKTTGRAWDRDLGLDPCARALPPLRQDHLPARIPSLAALDAHLAALDIPRSGYLSRAPSSRTSASDKQSTAPSSAPATRVLSKTSKIPAPAKKTDKHGRRHRFIFFQ
ncbi:hypothetical protein ACHAQA_008645 [Verticillium albo-atrum]